MPRLALSMLATGLLVGAAACGDDDDAGADTTASDSSAASTTASTAHGTDHTGAPGTTLAPAGTADPDVAAFCQAELAAEKAASSGDPASMGPAFDALVAAAPADLSDAVGQVVANGAEGPGSPAFDAPYAEVIGFMKDHCGFNELNVQAGEYAYGGLPDELAAGPLIITLDNLGEEFHELLLFRVNDGVTETAEELLALPDDEVMQKVTMSGAAFAPNGATSFTALDVAPGRYVAVCFLPQGATPDVMAQMDGPESSLPEGAGPPHFTAGMVHELTVS